MLKIINDLEEGRKAKKQLIKSKEIINQYKKLIKRISHECEVYSGMNWYNSPSVGFRKIKEVAETPIADLKEDIEVF